MPALVRAGNLDYSYKIVVEVIWSSHLVFQVIWSIFLQIQVT